MPAIATTPAAMAPDTWCMEAAFLCSVADADADPDEAVAVSVFTSTTVEVLLSRGVELGARLMDELECRVLVGVGVEVGVRVEVGVGVGVGVGVETGGV